MLWDVGTGKFILIERDTVGHFVIERLKSVVSKKLAAAVMAEGVVAGTGLVGVPLIVYIVVQGLVDLGRHFIDSRSE